MRGDRHSEHTRNRGSGQHDPESVARSVGERSSSGNSDESVIGSAKAVQAIVLAPVRSNLSAAREGLDEVACELASRSRFTAPAPGERHPACRNREARGEQADREHDARGR